MHSKDWKWPETEEITWGFENLPFKVLCGEMRHEFKFDPDHRDASIIIEEDGFAIWGTGSSWYSILGDKPISADGEILITFEVISLV